MAKKYPTLYEVVQEVLEDRPDDAEKMKDWIIDSITTLSDTFIFKTGVQIGEDIVTGGRPIVEYGGSRFKFTIWTGSGTKTISSRESLKSWSARS